jgi:hypothetical protein
MEKTEASLKKLEGKMSTQSDWDSSGIEAAILDILKNQITKKNYKHMGEYVYMTSYQIAIAINDKYQSVFSSLGKSLGGVGSGTTDSLPRYIARMLSERIGNCKITNVEGAFISNENQTQLSYQFQQQTVVSSLIGREDVDLSIYRYKP